MRGGGGGGGVTPPHIHCLHMYIYTYIYIYHIKFMEWGNLKTKQGGVTKIVFSQAAHVFVHYIL